MRPGALFRPGTASHVLLGGAEEDSVADEPPLHLQLTDEEVADLRRDPGAAAAAATWYGPADQDKTSNQDFALTARLCVGGKDFLFAAVADGVSTRTFWAARTARIACLVAFRVIRDRMRTAPIFSEADLADMRRGLASALRVELEADRRHLLAENVIPAGWSVEVFRRHLDRSEHWYNSTLLLAVLSQEKGFLLFAGDGGINVVKKAAGVPAEVRVPLASTEALAISSFVSLAVSEADFQAAWLSDIGTLSRVDVILASDGVDRTLQRRHPEAKHPDYRCLDLASSAAIRKEMLVLAGGPDRELDNYSLARLTWPPGASWPTPDTAQPVLHPPPAPKAPLHDELGRGSGEEPGLGAGRDPGRRLVHDLAVAAGGAAAMLVAVALGLTASDTLRNRLQGWMAAANRPVLLRETRHVELDAGDTVDLMKAIRGEAGAQGFRLTAVSSADIVGNIRFDPQRGLFRYEASGFAELPSGERREMALSYSFADTRADGERRDGTGDLVLAVRGTKPKPLRSEARTQRIEVLPDGAARLDVGPSLAAITLDLAKTSGSVTVDRVQGKIVYRPPAVPPLGKVADQFAYSVRGPDGPEIRTVVDMIMTSPNQTPPAEDGASPNIPPGPSGGWPPPGYSLRGGR
ncbi:hypothetical protein TSH100_23625 [Azospirillum sp. TSH100]|nr:hypothetical protein TSH100_23625 [Azospirillum sp. TSH100]